MGYLPSTGGDGLQQKHGAQKASCPLLLGLSFIKKEGRVPERVGTSLPVVASDRFCLLDGGCTIGDGESSRSDNLSRLLGPRVHQSH